jgi:hypothetical protein
LIHPQARMLQTSIALGLSLTALLGGIVSGAEQHGALLPGYLPPDAPLPQHLLDHSCVNVMTLADTRAGPVQVLRLGSGDADGKPGIAIVGGVSAELPCGTELALRLAERLAEGLESGGEVGQTLSRVTFYVIPCAAPEALTGFTVQPTWERTANARPTDDDHDGAVDEDGYEDLNGDGVITQLRVADPTGGFRVHPADPRVLIAADASRNETGVYAVYGEGVDDDGDGLLNEDPPGGVDFNRNFPFRYPYFEAGAGPHQVSEKETRAVADFLFDHPNIAVVLSYSTEDNLLHPWQAGYDSDPGPHQGSVMHGDDMLYNYLGEQYRKLLEPCGLAQDQPEAHGGAGSFVDWAYFHYGRLSLAVQPWWPVQPPAAPQDAASGDAAAAPVEDVGSRGQDDIRALAWMQATGVPGFVEWTALPDHPDFPGRTVEVGGFKPYIRLNPPLEQLDALAAQHYAFMQQLVGLMPRLAASQVEVEQLGAGVRRVKLTIANLGYLPTMLAMGEACMQAYPLRYTLHLPDGAALIGCYPRGEVARLAGNGGSTELVWLLRGEGALQADIGAPAVGMLRVTINLGDGSWEQQ